MKSNYFSTNVNEEVENFLNNHVRLEQEEPIDCSDLFEEKDVKERILVYSVNLFLNNYTSISMIL